MIAHASLSPFALAPAFAAGAFAGRGLAATIRRLARAGGYSSSRYYSLAGGGLAAACPILGHFLSPKGSRCPRLLLLEAAGGFAAAACWELFPAGKAFCGALFLLALLAAFFIDLDHMIIPDVFTIGLAVAGLLLSALVPALHGERSAFYILDSLRSGADAMAGLIAGSGVILWIALISEAILKKEAMGFGDVKFVGAIGAFCGWHGAVFAIFGGAAVGTLWIALALAWQKVSGRPGAGAPRAETPEGEPAEMGLGVHVPFGPMLAVAGAIYFLFLRGPVDAWFGQVNALL
jgi:leader peptidase (prepilin peptidase)/N-methyltransferase